MTDIIKVFEYLRVSTQKQKKDLTIKIQEILNREYRERSKVKIVVEKVFIDDGKSGYKGKEERPAYFRMLDELVRRDDIKGILAYNLSRLGRDLEERTKLKKLLQKHNKTLFLVQYSISDLNTFDGELIYDLRSVLDSYFGKLTIHRLQTARRLKYKESPEIFGRPRKKVPEKLLKKIKTWYTVKKYGYKHITKLILAEDITEYPKWFRDLYPNGFGKPDKEKGEKSFYISPMTVRERLKKMKIELRPLNNRMRDLTNIRLRSDDDI